MIGICALCETEYNHVECIDLEKENLCKACGLEDMVVFFDKEMIKIE